MKKKQADIVEFDGEEVRKRIKASGARFKEVAVMIGIHDKSLSRALHRGTMSKYYFDKMQELLTVLEAM